MLASMGFSEEHVAAALGACGQNSERAADWLFSHADDLAGAVAALSVGEAAGGGDGGGGNGGGSGGASTPMDGPGIYKLRGFVSHIGKNTGSGHYVCHGLKKMPPAAGTVAEGGSSEPWVVVPNAGAAADAEGEERWVIFNDSAVALSENPPREHAYMYLYERAA